jgi:hypothetical protein
MQVAVDYSFPLEFVRLLETTFALRAGSKGDNSRRNFQSGTPEELPQEEIESFGILNAVRKTVNLISTTQLHVLVNVDMDCVIILSLATL